MLELFRIFFLTYSGNGFRKKKVLVHFQDFSRSRWILFIFFLEERTRKNLSYRLPAGKF